MGQMPREPEAFAEQVAAMALRLLGEGEAVHEPNNQLRVGERRVDVDNLRRIVAQNPEKGVQLVEQYLDHALGHDAALSEMMPLDLVRHKLMPRLHNESILDRLDPRTVAHTPYVNGAVVLYVVDMPQTTVSVSIAQMVKWGLDADQLESIALDNLRTYRTELEFRLLRSNDGGVAVLLSHQDGYDASRLLLEDLHATLAPKLGGDFYAAVPARDILLAVSRQSEFSERMHQRVEHDFKRLPYPITPNYFYVTLDGVAGMAA